MWNGDSSAGRGSGKHKSLQMASNWVFEERGLLWDGMKREREPQKLLCVLRGNLTGYLPPNKVLNPLC